MKNLLEDLLPTKVRLWLYLFVFVGATAFGVWQASEGNWLTFVGGLFVAFNGLLAAGNTPKPELPPTS